MPKYVKFDKTIQDSLRKDPKLIVDKIKSKELTNISDNWSNVLTGLNQAKDKSRYTTFSGYTVLDDTMLGEIWIGDGIGKRLIECPVDDMTREWFIVKDDTDAVIEAELFRLDAKQHINLVLKWAALFAGGVNVLGISDGGKLDEPVNLKSIKAVDWIRTYDRTETAITEYHFNMDPEKDNYGELEFLTILPKYSAPFNVHIDRMLIWKGLSVPNKMDTGNFYYWGMSELQPIWKQFSNLGAGMDHIVKILYEFIIGYYGIDGFAQLIAEGKKSQIEDMISIIDLAKSTIQSVIRDTKDTFTRDSISVAGLSDLLDRFMMMLAGARGIPITRLFGRSAAGMNATGAGDEKVYYDMIKSDQESRMTKNLLKLITYINIGLGNKIPDLGIEFNSLFQQSKLEELQCKKIQAETDDIYIQDGVLLSDEVAGSRFGGEDYSYETKIDPMNREEPEPEMTEKERMELEIELSKNNNPNPKEESLPKKKEK